MARCGEGDRWHRSHNRNPVKSAACSTAQTDSKDIVKKTFKLLIDGKHPDRVLDATKHEIRQYVKRERRKTLPDGVDFWDFDCQFGLTPETATGVHFANITALIDSVAKEGTSSFYLELIAKPGLRNTRSADNQSEGAV